MTSATVPALGARSARVLVHLAAASLTAASLLGCDDAVSTDAGVDAGLPDAGPSCTEPLFGPDAATLHRWPEPALLRERADTVTGLGLAFDADRFVDLAARLRGYAPVFTEDLSELDGFGTNAEAYFTFGRGFDPGALPDLEESGRTIGFVVVGPEAPRVVRAFVHTADDGRTLLLAPDRPLPARAEVAAFVTTGLAGTDCLRASAAQRAELEAPDARTAAAIDALVTLGVIGGVDELAALTAYPTQSVVEGERAVLEDIDAGPAPSFVAAPTCRDEGAWIRCDARYLANDYRDADGVHRRAASAPATPVRSYEVPVTFWLPKGATAPYPTLFFGHGLGGSREQARRLAELAAPLGWATVATPALEHGEHPTNEDPSAETLNVVLEFFAVGELRERAVHATRLRDHFRQTTWDRLQLTRLLREGPDVDGDGAADVDPDRLMYLGVSLGGLMGPQLLASTDAYPAGVLVVPGGGVSSIIRDSSLFSALIDLLRPRGTSEGDVRRFFPVLQTVLDAGDPASFAPYVLERRGLGDPGPGALTPSVLVGVVLDDDVVPNVSNYTLGRALGVPIVAPVRRPEPGFEVVTGPLMGNFAGGAATGGLLQFDYVAPDGTLAPATHNNIGDSAIGAAAWLDFLETHLAGLARVRDPYAATAFPRP